MSPFPFATITLSCGGNSVKRIKQLIWTGRSSIFSRVRSGVFPFFAAHEATHPLRSSTFSVRQILAHHAKRGGCHVIIPRQELTRLLGSVHSDREGVFPFLGGA
jgi:hypothetical protein